MKIRALFVTACLLALTPALGQAQENRPAAGKPFLSPLFGDNMVLQRDRRDPIWGWTRPGERVTVRLGGKTVEATADAQGKWQARLAPMRAGGPYTITISGPQQATLRNVLFGDVWICSGQSNMEFGVGNLSNAAQEIARANFPQIRLFTVRKDVALEPQATLAGQWLTCTPANIRVGDWGGFSAVGYFFGRDLYQKLHVPIGLIHTSWGGTPAESWTSARALDTIPDFRPAVAQVVAQAREQQKGPADYAARMAAWYAGSDPGSAPEAHWEAPALDDSAWETITLPGYWERAGIPALSAFDGVVWFRKEFDLPAGAIGKDATLHLGPIDDRDTTWVNGRKVGGLETYDQPRDYAVPAALLRPGRNVLAVRVLDTGASGGFYGRSEQMSLEIPGAAPVSLAGPWKYRIGVSLPDARPLPLPPGQDQNAPTVLYNGMIAPLIPYGITGAIWYQGESNAGRAYQYRTLLPTMIRDWRARWGQGDFPFLIVQLANFMAARPEPGEDAWAELREAQLMTSRRVPNTGLAVTIDIGDARDIHPKDKQDVGQRLARAALAVAYGQKGEYSGPLYASMTRQGHAIRLSFTHVGGGLVARGGGKLQGFAIAGADRHFVWADARIDGKTVVVSSPQVPQPVAVRYAWASNPRCNLSNRAGLPASPFRTDAWPGITVHNK